eukprot:Tbor_TRINITY_DN4987_c8_g9::TRINITY_DN4987_c8_g9_i1::g.9826::m.9826/K03016/RPB8, POLR2H; DNA-directed RNA polymerases I, II, and III subunit RPABC3
MNPRILRETFTVKELDRDGRLYMRVSRAVCISNDKDRSICLTTDFNREEYPMEVGDKIDICIASTLNRDGAKGNDFYDHSLYHRDSLLSDYDYAMHGKVYECVAEGKTSKVLASFGGLLMQVEGAPSALRDFHLNSDIYFLMKKVE